MLRGTLRRTRTGRPGRRSVQPRKSVKTSPHRAHRAPAAPGDPAALGPPPAHHSPAPGRSAPGTPRVVGLPVRRWTPSTPQPSKNNPAMVNGIATSSSRQVGDQSRQLRRLSGRSSARPTPISDTSTATSVTCSTTLPPATGWNDQPSGSGVSPITMPSTSSTSGSGQGDRSDHQRRDDRHQQREPRREVDRVGTHSTSSPRQWHRPKAHPRPRTEKARASRPDTRDAIPESHHSLGLSPRKREACAPKREAQEMLEASQAQLQSHPRQFGIVPGVVEPGLSASAGVNAVLGKVMADLESVCRFCLPWVQIPPPPPSASAERRSPRPARVGVLAYFSGAGTDLSLRFGLSGLSRECLRP